MREMQAMRYYVSARFWGAMDMRSVTPAQLASVTGTSVNALDVMKSRPRSLVSDEWARAAAALLRLTKRREFEFYFLPAPSFPPNGASKLASETTAA